MHQFHAVARDRDDPLHEVLSRLLGLVVVRILKNDYVITMDLLVGKKMVKRGRVRRKSKFVDQEVVAYQEGVLHGPGRNLEGLHHKRGAKHRQDHSDDQRFKRVTEARFLVGINHAVPLSF